MPSSGSRSGRDEPRGLEGAGPPVARGDGARGLLVDRFGFDHAFVVMPGENGAKPGIPFCRAPETVPRVLSAVQLLADSTDAGEKFCFNYLRVTCLNCTPKAPANMLPG